MRLVFHNLANHFVGAADVYLQFDLRIKRREFCQRFGQAIDETLTDCQDHRAALQSAQSLQRFEQNLLLRQTLAVIAQHLVPRLRRLHAAPMPLQQGRAELVFELRDLAADR